MLKALTLDHSKLCRKFFKRWEYQDTFSASWETCMQADQETIVKTRHAMTDWLKIGEGECQGYILSPWLPNLHAEYIMWNAGLDEAPVGIKSARSSINDLRYIDDTTLMTESREELTSLLMNVKEDSEKGVLKLNIQKQRSWQWHLVP